MGNLAASDARRARFAPGTAPRTGQGARGGADAVIVGSALVERIARGEHPRQLASFLAGLRPIP